LTDLRVGERIYEKYLIGVAVHVDETGRDREAGAIDTRCGISSGTIADASDPAVFERDIGIVPGRPGTIYDETTAKNDVKHSMEPISAAGLASALSGTTYIDITRGRFLAPLDIITPVALRIGDS